MWRFSLETVTAEEKREPWFVRAQCWLSLHVCRSFVHTGKQQTALQLFPVQRPRAGAWPCMALQPLRRVRRAVEAPAWGALLALGWDFVSRHGLLGADQGSGALRAASEARDLSKTVLDLLRQQKDDPSCCEAPPASECAPLPTKVWVAFAGTGGWAALLVQLGRCCLTTKRRVSYRKPRKSRFQ